MKTKIKKAAALVCVAMLMISISACGEKTETKESSKTSETNSVATYPDSSAADSTTVAAATEATTTAAEIATTAAKADADSSSPAASDANIVGSWEYESGGFVYTFNDNGTGTYDVAGNVMNFTYETDGTKLKITYEGSPAMELEYELNGDTLNVKDSTGNDTIYKRK